MSGSEESTGPVEDYTWPTRLPAHVVADGERPRVHGFDLLDDLARHYDFGEFLVTALTGSPPSAPWGTAVNMALIALAGAGVGRASVHAATLARRCGADDSNVLATGMLGLAEEASADALPPPPGTSPDPSAFREALPHEVRISIPQRLSLEDTALEVLRGAGLEAPIQRMAALCVARLPALVAEALAVRRGDLQGYPMRLPDFQYQDPSADD